MSVEYNEIAFCSDDSSLKDINTNKRAFKGDPLGEVGK